MSRTVSAALLIAGSFSLILMLLIGYGTSHTQLVAAQGTSEYNQHAGVVISFGNGAVLTRCVDLGEDRTANAIVVLESARPTLTLEIEEFANSAQVCKIEDTGCPANNCICDCAVGIPQACQAFNSWRRYTLGDGAWQTATTELQRAEVGAGNVEGWAWGTHTISQITPPVLAFDDICVSAVLTPTSTPTITPTITPTSTPTASPTPSPTNAVPTDTAPTDTPAPTASVEPSVRPTIDRRQEAPAPAEQPVENPPTAAPPTPTITPRPIQPTRTPLPSNTPLPAPSPTDLPPTTSAPVQDQPAPPVALPAMPGNLPSPTSVPTALPTVPPPTIPPTTPPPPTAPPLPTATPNLLATELALPSLTPATTDQQQAQPTALPTTVLPPTPPPATATPMPDVAGVPSGGGLAGNPDRPIPATPDEQNTASRGGWLLYISLGLMLVLFLLLLLTLQIRTMRQRE